MPPTPTNRPRPLIVLLSAAISGAVRALVAWLLDETAD